MVLKKIIRAASPSKRKKRSDNEDNKYSPPSLPRDTRLGDERNEESSKRGIDAVVSAEQLERLTSQITQLLEKTEKNNNENQEMKSQMASVIETLDGAFSNKGAPEPEPRPEDRGSFDLTHGPTTWVVSGYSSPEPIPDKSYFSGLIWKQDAEISAPERVISGIIPCFNERGVDLERTIRSLYRQRMSAGFRVEFVIVMDGVDHMEKSMSSYLSELFGIKVNSGDADKDPFVVLPEAEIIIVEPLDQEAASSRTRAFRSARGGYSLVLKKKNHRKANSQMWWLGSHASDIKCEYALATDCGTVFDPMATIRLIQRMDNEYDLHAVTGFQRIMTSHMQGDGHFEFLHSPQQFLLRMVQRFEFEVDHVSFKAVHDSIGYMSVIPGPCGLYRYSQLGSLRHGLMKQYFSIFQRQSQGLILGNVEIVEDRIPGTLLVFPITEKSEKHQTAMPRTGWPRTGFVYDALFYVEAEKPLSQLVKQRRRWLNGTFAAYIWMLREGIITRSNQDFYIKALSFLVVIINVIQSMVVRMCGPALLIVWMFRFGLFLPDLLTDPANVFDPTVNMIELEMEPFRLWCGLGMGGGYLLLYIAFVIGHTPRAKPVQDKNDLPIVRYTEPTKYASDKASAYRAWLYQPVLWLSFIVIFLYFLNAIGIVSTLGWEGTPIIVRVLIIFCGIPFVIGFLDGCIRCSFQNFWGMLYSAPLAMPLVIWFTIWLPAYSSARLSDLTWGNRDSSGFDESAKALQRAKHGRRFARFLILSNTVIAVTMIGLMNIWGETFPIFVFSYTVVMTFTYVIVIIDMIYRFFSCLAVPICERDDIVLLDVSKDEDEVNTVKEEEDSNQIATDYAIMDNNATVGMEMFLCGNTVVKTDAAGVEVDGDDDDFLWAEMACLPLTCGSTGNREDTEKEGSKGKVMKSNGGRDSIILTNDSLPKKAHRRFQTV